MHPLHEKMSPVDRGEIAEVEVNELDLREDLLSLCLPCCGPTLSEMTQ